MERTRRLMIAMVRKVLMMFLSPQHQGTVVGSCENDKGVGVGARRGGGGDEDGDGFVIVVIFGILGYLLDSIQASTSSSNCC